MIVIFLHGPPAASKYNVGKALSALLGIPLFHNHLTLDLVKALFDFGTPGFVALREQVWRVAFEAAAATGQSFIFTFNPEQTVDPDLIGRLERIIEQGGGELHFVELRCTDLVVEDRLANESRAANGQQLHHAATRHDGGRAPTCGSVKYLCSGAAINAWLRQQGSYRQVLAPSELRNLRLGVLRIPTLARASASDTR